MNRPPQKLRVLVIDDSALYRKIVRQVLAALPDVEVVGTAADGELALKQIEKLRPDVVTLDFEMPRLNGLGVLRRMSGGPAAIMVSAFTAEGATATTQALAEGAFDFILKPTTRSLEQSAAQLRQDLQPKLHALRLRARCGAASAGRPAAPRPTGPPCGYPAARPAAPRRRDVVAIAVSTGGPQALTKVLPRLPRSLPCPVVIVQHMPPMFTASLAADLDRRCPLNVVEGVDGMAVEPGRVIIAPGGKQMRVAAAESAALIQITNDPPERNCKPAADYLFRSVASAYGAGAAAVVLTGMGDDGNLGAGEIKRAGGAVIAQDEASCVVYGMPRAVVESGHADAIAPLDQVAERILQAAQGRAYA